MTTITSSFEGLDEMREYITAFPNRTRRAARLAINTTINRKGMKLVQDAMYDDIAFPKNYLKGDRLFVNQLATEGNLVGSILGRKRATSLARFAAPGTPIGSQARAGVRVMVSRGASVRLANAWLVRLRRGASLSEDNFNVGLAVRVQPGETVYGKKSSHSSWLVPGQVALLYGPSVNQVFKDVAEENGQQVLDLVSDEFFRQFERLAGS